MSIRNKQGSYRWRKERAAHLRDVRIAIQWLRRHPKVHAMIMESIIAAQPQITYRPYRREEHAGIS